MKTIEIHVCSDNSPVVQRLEIVGRRVLFRRLPLTTEGKGGILASVVERKP
jgi:hypothetical protein